MQMGGKLFQGIRLGESQNCVPHSLLATAAKTVAQSAGHLNGAQPNGAMKMTGVLVFMVNSIF